MPPKKRLNSQSRKSEKKIIKVLYPNHMHIFLRRRKHQQSFKNNPWKTVRGVADTRYPLSIPLISFLAKKDSVRKLKRQKTSRPKGNDRSHVSNIPRSNMVFSALKAGNFKVNCPLWPNFEHTVSNFMPAQVTCKFHKDTIKN